MIFKLIALMTQKASLYLIKMKKACCRIVPETYLILFYRINHKVAVQ